MTEEQSNARGMSKAAIEWKHADLLYDYIKFHLGLYIATPPAFVIIAEGLGVSTSVPFLICMVILVITYFISGAAAGCLIARFINKKWNSDRKWRTFAHAAHSSRRRYIQHWLYWIGIVVGVLGVFLGMVL